MTRTKASALARASILCGALLLTATAPAAAQRGPRTVQPGAPGEAGRVLTGEEAAGPRHRHTEADVRFMQGMILHHAQALEMAALVAPRTSRPDIHALARRIELSQEDEILLMTRWLEERGESVPGPSAEDGGHDDRARPGAAAGHETHGAAGRPSPMPGMLTREDLARLAEARGAEFDRLFLSAMIHHHEGALLMVGELLSSPGSAHDAELFQLASHIDADQRIEIARMRRMLTAGRQPPDETQR